ncbi:hypothetical protein FocTR4_00012378 [Fusarium oxysporum f. sp. cubense]|uniref:Uncharacterized protein n=1 Tax=Fusarium oxysporum f. sp. cubense TaxID=61366 RepID=A0A5C6SJ30_FUSOC|nr:hypothetical protein FocTR4_00012378 [Fusarium oxysporum f. sp. cubense]
MNIINIGETREKCNIAILRHSIVSMMSSMSSMAILQVLIANHRRGSKAVVMPLPYGDFRGTDWMRGIYLALGWQTDRIEIPFRVSCFLLMICFIWFCAILWRGGGRDWGTSFAFAQVVAASIAIVISYARL